MLFRELVLDNFGPYMGRQVINLCPDAGETTRPIILFGGMNGGGKTTLMDAIRLALYGIRAQCSTRGNLSYSDFLNQCVNRSSKFAQPTRIELVFEVVEDSKLLTVRVVRHWLPNQKDGKDNLGILVGDDEWKDEALTNTWDEYIENLLPLGISNLFLFDGEQVKELAEQDVPPSLVVEAIQSLLGLELAERLAQDLDILASRKRKEIATAKQLVSLEEIEQKLKQYDADMEIASEQLSSLTNKLQIAKKNQSAALDKFAVEGGRIARDRQLLEEKQATLSDRADSIRRNMRELAASSLPLTLIAPLLEQAQAQADKETRSSQAKIAYDVVRSRDSRLIDYIAQLEIALDRVEKIKEFLQAENQELAANANASETPWLGIDEKSLEQLASLLKLEINSSKTQAAENLAELEKLEIEIEALDRQIAKAASPEEYEQLRSELDAAQAEAVKVQAEYELANRRVEDIKRAIEKTKKELQEFADENFKLQNNQHIINSIGKAQNTLKLFKEKLTLKKINKLEIEVTECFRYLLHKSDLVHRVAIDTQTFALSIYDSQGQPVPKHRLSAGEKQLLAIAFLWGLARVSGRKLPVAIDTPLGRLDSSHRHNLVERYFPAASHQVILLSTDTEIGKVEFEQLQKLEAIARTYLLKYHPGDRHTTVELNAYFW